MAKFIINSKMQSNGDHEVHNATIGCSYMPTPEQQIEVGEHETCDTAVAQAKRMWTGTKINGCYYCCNECHTR
jgi:hypothetical protein